MSKKSITLHLFFEYILLFFSTTAFAGNHLGVIPMNYLPAKLNGAFSYGFQMGGEIKRPPDDDTFSSESQTRKQTDFNDDDLDFNFGEDSEEETDVLVPPLRQRKGVVGYQTVLEWDETQQRYVAILIRLLTVDLKKKEPLPDDGFFPEVDAELTEPDINTTPVRPPWSSSSESNYTRTRTGGEGDSSSSIEDEVEEENTGDNTQGTPASERENSKKVSSCLTFVEFSEVSNSEHYLKIENYHGLSSASLTDTGAAELQAGNPELFATVEDATIAFNALKQVGFENTKNTLEYQALARLIFQSLIKTCSLTEDDAITLQAKNPGHFATVEDVTTTFSKLKQAGFEPMLPTMQYYYIRILLHKHKKVDTLILCQLFSSITPGDYTDCVYINYLSSRCLLQDMTRSNFRKIERKGDDETLLVICSGAYTPVGPLTEAGAHELQVRNPDIFPSKLYALSAFEELNISESVIYDDINTQEYQAIASLIQHFIQKNNIQYIVFEDKSGSHQPSPFLKTIPYGMIRHRHLSFSEDDGKFRVSKSSIEKYELFDSSKKCLLNIKYYVFDPNVDPDVKIQMLQLLFPLDDNELTMNKFITNVDCLIGPTYEKAQKSFQRSANKKNSFEDE